jgi:transketolase
MLAGTLRQGNLIALVDHNHIQSMGADVIEQANLADRFSAFGWSAVTIDGHDAAAIEKALRTAHERPLAVIANTTKGKGISFMEGRLEWHYKSPNPLEYEAALKELNEDNAN